MTSTQRPVAEHPSALLVPPGRIDALQGVRGLAVLLVVTSHALASNPESGALGAMGVTMFFTLSGFLITGVLLASRRESLRHLGGFYGARAVRLLPALVALIVVTGAVWLLTGRPLARFAEYAATSLLYVENFFAGQHHDQVLAHTWSLAVEEQFYFLWPFLLVLLMAIPRTRRLLVVGALVAASAALRLLLFRTGHGAIGYASLPSNAYALLLGCLVRLAPLERWCRQRMAWLGLAGIALLAVVAWRIPGPLTVVPIGVAVCTAAVILGSLHGNRLLASRPLVFLGAVSYAWYLWHWPVLWLTGTLHRAPGSIPVAIVSLGLATLSTYLLEEPLRRRYQRWLRTRGARSGVVAVGGA